MLDFANYNVPRNIQTALTDYIERGIPVGSFLHAVLSNDLFDAVSRTENSDALSDIVNWIHDCAPQNCYGCEAVVLRWIQEHPSRKPRGPKDLA